MFYSNHYLSLTIDVELSVKLYCPVKELEKK